MPAAGMPMPHATPHRKEGVGRSSWQSSMAGEPNTRKTGCQMSPGQAWHGSRQRQMAVLEQRNRAEGSQPALERRQRMPTNAGGGAGARR